MATAPSLLHQRHSCDFALSCYAHAHYSALVPAGWKSSLSVDSNKLIPIPEAIEDARLLAMVAESER